MLLFVSCISFFFFFFYLVFFLFFFFFSYFFVFFFCFFFFSSRRRHTRFDCDWSSDVCSSDLRSGSGGRSGCSVQRFRTCSLRRRARELLRGPRCRSTESGRRELGERQRDRRRQRDDGAAESARPDRERRLRDRQSQWLDGQGADAEIQSQPAAQRAPRGGRVSGADVPGVFIPVPHHPRLLHQRPD